MTWQDIEIDDVVLYNNPGLPGINIILAKITKIEADRLSSDDLYMFPEEGYTLHTDIELYYASKHNLIHNFGKFNPNINYSTLVSEQYPEYLL